MVMLNINTASFVELTSLPGVGKNMAQQIIDRRGDAQGCLTLDSFDDKPSLQARLKGFLEDGLLSFVPNHVSSGGMGEVGLTSIFISVGDSESDERYERVNGIFSVGFGVD